MTVRLKKTLTIIVATVVVEDDNILMVQEAKPECLGLWYLPAGRLERHESLVEGARRECKEEAGLDIDIVGLLCVEVHSAQWMRISFVGRHAAGAAGQLKQVPDKESLTADWVPLAVVLAGGSARWPLRAPDILGPVQRAVERSSRSGSRIGGPVILPTETPHERVQLQLFLVAGDRSLLIDVATKRAPIIAVPVTDARCRSIGRLLADFFRNQLVDLPLSSVGRISVLAIEFSGTCRGASCSTDGIQLDVFIRIDSKPQLSASSSKLQWDPWTGTNWHPNMVSLADDDLPTLIVLR